MRDGFSPAAVAAVLLAAATAHAQEVPGEKKKKDVQAVEEAVIRKATERELKPGPTEREVWVKWMGKSFPGRVGTAATAEEFGRWFDQLSAGGGSWDQDPSRDKLVSDLHTRVSERLYGRPGGSIGRGDFLGYARLYLLPDSSPPWKVVDGAKEAEKLFRVLDKNRDGVLSADEWTEGLRSVSAAVDRNRDGVIDADEYRGYLSGRVSLAVAGGPPPVAALPPPEKEPAPEPAKKPAPPPKPKLPAWFEELDADHDGQVGLYEWRAAGRPTAEFVAMDLDGDGLLPPEEYLRYLRQSQAGK